MAFEQKYFAATETQFLISRHQSIAKRQNKTKNKKPSMPDYLCKLKNRLPVYDGVV
jgi:hypothetical protein